MSMDQVTLQGAESVVPIIDTDQIKLTVLTTQQAVDGWETIVPYLDQVFERSAGRLGPEDTLQAITDGMAEVMLIWDPPASRIYAVIIAEARVYPKRRVMSLGLCGGAHIHLWAEKMWPAMQHVAKKKGFNQLEITGRRGWKRFIPGAEEIATFYAIDLDQEEEA